MSQMRTWHGKRPSHVNMYEAPADTEQVELISSLCQPAKLQYKVVS